MPARRSLTFTNLDEVIEEVERLLGGHATVGQWSLGQICNHLAVAIRLTARPAAAEATGTAEQASLRERFFAAGTFPDGRSAPPPIAPAPGLEAADEAAKLRAAIERFASATGPYPAHPVLGPLTRDEWVRFHLMHAAHHLGFAVPTV